MLKILTGTGVYISQNGKYEQIPHEAALSPLELQLHEFMECIRNNKEPECSGAYSRSVIAVLESVYRSHETGMKQLVE